MNKRKYYYLIAGLPDLIPDDKKLTFSSVQITELSAGKSSSFRF
jgi:hypothetical protein